MPQDHFHHLKNEEAIYPHAALEFFFHDTRYSWFFRTFWCFLQKAWIFFFFTKKLLLVSSYLFLLFACTYNCTRCRTNHNWLPASHLTCSFTVGRFRDWVAIGAFFQTFCITRTYTKTLWFALVEKLFEPFFWFFSRFCFFFLFFLFFLNYFNSGQMSWPFIDPWTFVTQVDFFLIP